MKIAGKVEKKLRSLPKEPGVYLFLGKAGRVLYVGKATELRSRVRSYFAGEGPEVLQIRSVFRVEDFQGAKDLQTPKEEQLREERSLTPA